MKGVDETLMLRGILVDVDTGGVAAGNMRNGLQKPFRLRLCIIQPAGMNRGGD